MRLPFALAGATLAVLAYAQQLSGTGAEYGLRLIQPAPGLAEMVAFNGTGLAFVGCADVGCELYWLAEFGFVPPQLVIDIEEGFGSSYPRELKPNGSVLYFAAASSALGTELYRWDISQGVAAAAVALLADAAPGAASSSPSGLCVLGGLLLFSATLDAGGVGTELYAYDATAPGRGVFLAADVAQGAGASSWPSSITAFGGRAYFSAATAEFGAELWAYDPATRAASLVQDINPGPKSSHPVDLRPFNGRLYFQAAHNGTGTELYSLRLQGRSPPVDIVADIDDGIAADADELADEMASSYPQQLTPVGRGALYFAASTVHNGTELWVMDGQTETVHMVADLDPGPPTSSPSSLIDLNGTLVWAAHDAAYGRELRILLPAPAATGAGGGASTALVPTLLADIAPGPASSDPAFLVTLNGYLYFTAFNASAMSMGFYMYAPPGGALPLPSLPPSPSPSPSGTATGTASASSSASETVSVSASAAAASPSPTAAAVAPGGGSVSASAAASASASASSPTPAASPSLSASRTPASGSASGTVAASGSGSGSVSPSVTHSAGPTPSAHASHSITPSPTHSPRASSPFYGSRSRTPTRPASGVGSASATPAAGGVVADDAAAGSGGGSSGGPPSGAGADDGGSGGVTATVVIVVLLAALGGGGFFVYSRYPAVGASVRRRLGLAPAASVQQLPGDGRDGSGGGSGGASTGHAATDGHLTARDGGPEDGDPSAPVAYFASPPRPGGSTAAAPGSAASAAALSFAAGSGARQQAGRRQERGRLRDAADEEAAGAAAAWAQHGTATPQARFVSPGPLSAAQGASDAEADRQPWQSPLQATVVPLEWKPPATAAEYEW